MHNNRRATLHYLISLLLFASYGIQVCPFLDSLTPAELLLPIITVFAAQWLIRRTAITPRLESLKPEQRVAHLFRADLTVFLIGGALLAAYFQTQYQFPLESGGKVIVGMTLLGFFIACELALHKEYELSQQLMASGVQLKPDNSPMPISRKFSWFASACAIAIVGVIFLLINKDLEWLIHTGDSIPLATSQRYILTEISFVVAILMAYVLAIILGYSRNLKLFIENQNSTLAAVADGDLTISAPVTSNDEFGLMAERTNLTINELNRRTSELNTTRDASILGLASLAETRDNETGAHIIRTQHYVKVLAEYLRNQGHFTEILTDETIELLFKSAPLHDVGKVGIPDSILLKPGKLTDDEFEIMKRHPMIGAEALRVAEAQLGSNSFLRYASEISESHHEKWDGSGYPKGLTGEEIPLSGRLMAVADVYDALISKRVYKPAFSHDKACSIIREGNGSHFDPLLIEAFNACEEEFKAVAEAHKDNEH